MLLYDVKRTQGGNQMVGTGSGIQFDYLFSDQKVSTWQQELCSNTYDVSYYDDNYLLYDQGQQKLCSKIYPYCYGQQELCLKTNPYYESLQM